MMIMLSPERASVLRHDGQVAFVVEGEPECSLGYECDDTTHDGRCGEPRPPATWVALDRKVVPAATSCDREHDAFQIDSCWCNGTVIVDAVMVEVLPVTADIWPWGNKQCERAVTLWYGAPRIINRTRSVDGQRFEPINLDTTPRPGVDWVVVLTMLSDGSPSARSDDTVQDGE